MTNVLFGLNGQTTTALACPICKEELAQTEKECFCHLCGSRYPEIKMDEGKTYDLRIRRPEFLNPTSELKWAKFQRIYEKVAHGAAERDNFDEYQQEIDSVDYLYRGEFKLTGRVLDVGGYQGRLRHFLDKVDMESYVSIDPFVDCFRGTAKPNLMRAYPVLAERCNFVPSHAEFLPFADECFDWIHIRSVLDHLADPYLAMREARRVLRSGGKVLIGLAIPERMAKKKKSLTKRFVQKRRQMGLFATLANAAGKVVFDDHNYRFTHQQLRDLIGDSGFVIETECWQRPPFDYCIYISAKKA